MKFVLFYHSLRSDWNHGNAHFLRGVVVELLARGHDVKVYEPADAWSVQQLRSEHGDGPIDAFYDAYPTLRDASVVYDRAALNLREATADADVVIVHEWSPHELVCRVGELRADGGRFQLLFHDTHHRAVTDADSMAAYDLRHYDGVLAFGAILRDLYLSRGWTRRAWTWHEAADVRVFHPMPDRPRELDLIWVGNWGDEERTLELQEFLLDPVRELHLKARIHGVRYPASAKAALAQAGVDYAGWLPNFAAPAVFAQAKVTVHVPRRPYTQRLPGIPTIRPFEALACGIPLICSPWDDAEHLFTPGQDYLVARDGAQMQQHLRAVLNEPELAHALATHGRQTILARHTCGHRVDQLLEILAGEGRVKIAFFGSSLVSAYWNGAATYYRGIVRALAGRGHRVTFYESDAYDRQLHRDIPDPPWATVVVYSSMDTGGVGRCLDAAAAADLVIKASGNGVFDELLESAVAAMTTTTCFWDVDAPATLERVRGNPLDPFRPLVPQFDVVLTYGGGDPVVDAYAALGAQRCVPIYNALDPSTHHPVSTDLRFEGDVGFLGNRLPDREIRVDEFFLKPAAALPGKRFLIGGNGWHDKPMPANVRDVGHVYTRDHNAFNCTPGAVLNINRESMARFGFSPATRVFEAAGAGACLITDAFVGIEQFFEPGVELLVANDGDQVTDILSGLSSQRARSIGLAALRRALAEHTYTHRVELLEQELGIAAIGGRS